MNKLKRTDLKSSPNLTLMELFIYRYVVPFHCLVYKYMTSSSFSVGVVREA